MGPFCSTVVLTMFALLIVLDSAPQLHARLMLKKRLVPPSGCPTPATVDKHPPQALSSESSGAKRSRDSEPPTPPSKRVCFTPSTPINPPRAPSGGIHHQHQIPDTQFHDTSTIESPSLPIASSSGLLPLQNGLPSPAASNNDMPSRRDPTLEARPDHHLAHVHAQSVRSELALAAHSTPRSQLNPIFAPTRHRLFSQSEADTAKAWWKLTPLVFMQVNAQGCLRRQPVLCEHRPSPDAQLPDAASPVPLSFPPDPITYECRPLERVTRSNDWNDRFLVDDHIATGKLASIEQTEANFNRFERAFAQDMSSNGIVAPASARGENHPGGYAHSLIDGVINGLPSAYLRALRDARGLEAVVHAHGQWCREYVEVMAQADAILFYALDACAIAIGVELPIFAPDVSLRGAYISYQVLHELLCSDTLEPRDRERWWHLATLERWGTPLWVLILGAARWDYREGGQPMASDSAERSLQAKAEKARAAKPHIPHYTKYVNVGGSPLSINRRNAGTGKLPPLGRRRTRLQQAITALLSPDGSARITAAEFSRVASEVLGQGVWSGAKYELGLHSQEPKRQWLVKRDHHRHCSHRGVLLARSHIPTAYFTNQYVADANGNNVVDICPPPSCPSSSTDRIPSVPQSLWYTVHLDGWRSNDRDEVEAIAEASSGVVGWQFGYNQLTDPGAIAPSTSKRLLAVFAFKSEAARDAFYECWREKGKSLKSVTSAEMPNAALHWVNRFWWKVNPHYVATVCERTFTVVEREELLALAPPYPVLPALTPGRWESVVTTKHNLCAVELFQYDKFPPIPDSAPALIPSLPDDYLPNIEMTSASCSSSAGSTTPVPCSELDDESAKLSFQPLPRSLLVAHQSEDLVTALGDTHSASDSTRTLPASFPPSVPPSSTTLAAPAVLKPSREPLLRPDSVNLTPTSSTCPADNLLLPDRIIVPIQRLLSVAFACDHIKTLTPDDILVLRRMVVILSVFDKHTRPNCRLIRSEGPHIRIMYHLVRHLRALNLPDVKFTRGVDRKMSSTFASEGIHVSNQMRVEIGLNVENVESLENLGKVRPDELSAWYADVETTKASHIANGEQKRTDKKVRAAEAALKSLDPARIAELNAQLQLAQSL
ncbi:hypothetical protein DL93DRAFT_2228771 [Clavulina sp. PMI_390]|nr:hypothetical protein DL93DRAFT_2228771 [Clavulina sp. PMI_390]